MALIFELLFILFMKKTASSEDMIEDFVVSSFLKNLKILRSDSFMIDSDYVSAAMLSV